ncbi:MAG: sulfur carrier protein ThiS [Deltaproteobacteria bacterium]|nr:sulfur carrier protein ThiS [Deltaproteobacteria bacterium]
MIRIQLNGQPKALDDALTIERLVQLLQLKSPHIAVALNYDVVPRQEFQKVTVKDGDKIEIIRPVVGG